MFLALEPKLEQFHVVWSAQGPAARGTFGATSCSLECQRTEMEE